MTRRGYLQLLAAGAAASANNQTLTVAGGEFSR